MRPPTRDNGRVQHENSADHAIWINRAFGAVCLCRGAPRAYHAEQRAPLSTHPPMNLRGMWSDHVVVDRNLITGQNPQSSKAFAAAITDRL